MEDRRKEESAKTNKSKQALAVEGLQVFGHGVGFYLHKGKGCVSLSLWEAS